MMIALSPVADRHSDRSAPPSAMEGRDAGDSARVCLGIITGAHGIKGWVRVKSFTADPEAIADYGPLSDESGARRFELELVGTQKGVLLVRIKDVDDRNAAERLKGLRLYVRRADLPPPEEGEFYEADLIGLAAMREDGTGFGTIRAVNDFGAGASLEIEDPSARWCWCLSPTPPCRWSMSRISASWSCRRAACSMRPRAMKTGGDADSEADEG